MADVSEYVLPPLLTARAVADRYGCDVRAARRIMRDAGALAAAGKLLIRSDALDEWERENARRTADTLTRSTSRRARFRRVDPRRLTDLEEEWWKEGQ